MARTLFVAGTDTGVGKTAVAVALLRALAGSGWRAAAMKPVASGREPGEALNADVAALVGAAGVAALSAGLSARALEMTVAYSKERVQFGRPIGSFQALKHRMAELLVLVEMSRSASWAASYAVSTRAPNAARLAHVAKSYCSDALNKVAAETIQLHGGIAITWEHDAQLVFKRAHALSQLFGAPHTHRELIEL
jgi:alkylation response protein AidB-like acyl-CoA dehydrogenase